MKKIKILLACAGGMSTELFCRKIREAALAENFDCEVSATSVSYLNDAVMKDVNVLLLAPQVRFHKEKLEAAFPLVPVENIPMQDYGMVNGAKVFKDLRVKYSWKYS